MKILIRCNILFLYANYIFLKKNSFVDIQDALDLQINKLRYFMFDTSITTIIVLSSSICIRAIPFKFPIRGRNAIDLFFYWW